MLGGTGGGGCGTGGGSRQQNSLGREPGAAAYFQ